MRQLPGAHHDRIDLVDVRKLRDVAMLVAKFRQQRNLRRLSDLRFNFSQ